MNLDGLTLAVLTRELSDQLVTGQIQRLLQIDKTTIVLKVNTHHVIKTWLLQPVICRLVISVTALRIYLKNRLRFACFYANIWKALVLQQSSN